MLLLSALTVPAGFHARALPAATEPSTAPRTHPALAPPPDIVTPPQPKPTWVNVTGTLSGAAPPRGSESSSAFDAAPGDNETVLFGGCLLIACPSNQTWVLANGSWHNITNPSDAPPARNSASMDYDANMQGVLLFGGDGTLGYFNDTWLFHGGRWTNLGFVGPMAPSPRAGASMTFDPQPEENGSVLFGGCVTSGLNAVCTNDTWVWAGWSGWVQLTPSLAPPAVGYSAMTFDVADQVLLLFGGCGGFLCLGVIGSTWELYSGQWWAEFPSSSPVNRTDASMVYSPKLGEVILFGGITAGFALDNTTWSFFAGTWTLLAPALAPSVRGSYALALDPTGQTPVLFGGALNTSSGNDTWVFEFPLAASIGANVSAAETSQTIGFTIPLSGGTGPFGGTVYFGDGTLGVVSGDGTQLTTTHVYTHPGNYTGSVNLTDGVGELATGTAAPVAISAGPLVAVLAAPASGDVGHAVMFIATPTYGVGPFSYTWSFGDGGVGTGASASHTYTTAGSYAVVVNLTDTHQGIASASVQETVSADPNASVRVNPTNPAAGSVATLLANVSGGTGPFNFSWLFGDGGSSGFATPTHTYSSPGAFVGHLWVNDSAGGSTSVRFTVEVGPASNPSGSTPGGSSSNSSPPLWFWAGVAVLLAVGVLGSALLVSRRRRPPPGPPASAPR
ncbi:MAG: PKD domain-containing protein [Thermoplasmata archaeon]|nr:PKD domain-containing protein [Thermoplasmata archaeon]